MLSRLGLLLPGRTTPGPLLQVFIAASLAFPGILALDLLPDKAEPESVPSR